MARKLTLLRRALKALLTLLLLTASITPAVAEIGCVRASMSHVTGAPANVSKVACACDTAPSGQKGAPDGAGHCAFSHGEHGVDIAFQAPLGGVVSVRPLFQRPLAVLLTATPRDGPERPPQA